MSENHHNCGCGHHHHDNKNEQKTEHHQHDNCCDNGIMGHCHVSDFSNKKRIIFVMVISFLYTIIEVILGIYSGSLALLADAGHSFTDGLALLLAFLGFHLADKKSDDKRSYGYHRFEILAAFVNGLFLAGLTIWIFVEALERVFNPVNVKGDIVFIVAFCGFLLNSLSFLILLKGDKKNLNMQGALYHVASDALASLTAMVAGVVITYTGYTIVDPILSLLLVVLLAKGSYNIIKKTVHILLEGTPSDFNQEEVVATLKQEVSDIDDIHHIHAWSLTLEKPLVTMHLKVKENCNRDNVLNKVKEVLKTKWNIAHSVIQIEKNPCPDSKNCF